MLRTTFVLVLALGAFQAARADRIIEQPETSFEMLLANANLPAGGVGDVNFKTCDTCDTVVRLLTPSTQFLMNGHPIAVADFLRAIADIKKAEADKPRSELTLYVDVKSERVNRVALTRPKR